MRAKRLPAFTRTHQLASKAPVGSAGRNHDLRLSPPGTTSMLLARVQPAGAIRMMNPPINYRAKCAVHAVGGAPSPIRRPYEATGRSELSRVPPVQRRHRLCSPLRSWGVLVLA